jgi:hypothetical protein
MIDVTLIEGKLGREQASRRFWQAQEIMSA